jgi:hypothetical protein
MITRFSHFLYKYHLNNIYKSFVCCILKVVIKMFKNQNIIIKKQSIKTLQIIYKPLPLRLIMKKSVSKNQSINKNLVYWIIGIIIFLVIILILMNNKIMFSPDESEDMYEENFFTNLMNMFLNIQEEETEEDSEQTGYGCSPPCEDGETCYYNEGSYYCAEPGDCEEEESGESDCNEACCSEEETCYWDESACCDEGEDYYDGIGCAVGCEEDEEFVSSMSLCCSGENINTPNQIDNCRGRDGQECEFHSNPSETSSCTDALGNSCDILIGGIENCEFNEDTEEIIEIIHNPDDHCSYDSSTDEATCDNGQECEVSEDGSTATCTFSEEGGTGCEFNIVDGEMVPTSCETGGMQGNSDTTCNYDDEGDLESCDYSSSNGDITITTTCTDSYDSSQSTIPEGVPDFCVTDDPCGTNECSMRDPGANQEDNNILIGTAANCNFYDDEGNQISQGSDQDNPPDGVQGDEFNPPLPDPSTCGSERSTSSLMSSEFGQDFMELPA